MPVALAFDVGGSTLRAALVDARGKVLARQKRPPGDRRPEALLADLVALGASLGAPKDAPVGLGIAAQLWTETGKVAVAPNLGWRDVALGDLAAQAFARRVRLVNDVNAIAVGEARVGAGAGAADVVVVFVGTGVGMGAVVGGRLLEGADGLATELGHIKLDDPEAGRLCECGERGCLEALTSGRHLPELLAEKVAQGTPSPLYAQSRGNARTIDAGSLEAAAVAGDRAAAELWAEVAVRLGRAIGNLVTLFNPRVLVLGGGVLAAAPSLAAGVRRELLGHAGAAQRQGLVLREAALGDDAGLVGAGLLAMDRPPA